MAEAKDVFDLPMSTGRWFSELDDEHHSPVVVICYDTQHELFGDQDPLGKEINIEGRLFEVVGTVQKIKSVFGGGKDPNDNRVILNADGTQASPSSGAITLMNTTSRQIQFAMKFTW